MFEARKATYTTVLRTANRDAYIFNELKNAMKIYIMNGAIEFLKDMKKPSKDQTNGIQDAFEVSRCRGVLVYGRENDVTEVD